MKGKVTTQLKKIYWAPGTKSLSQNIKNGNLFNKYLLDAF